MKEYFKASKAGFKATDFRKFRKIIMTAAVIIGKHSRRMHCSRQPTPNLQITTQPKNSPFRNTPISVSYLSPFHFAVLLLILHNRARLLHLARLRPMLLNIHTGGRQFTWIFRVRFQITRPQQIRTGDSWQRGSGRSSFQFRP